MRTRQWMRGGGTMFDWIDKAFVICALASMALSMYLMRYVSHEYGIFVGLWVPSILGFWIGFRICAIRKGA